MWHNASILSGDLTTNLAIVKGEKNIERNNLKCHFLQKKIIIDKYTIIKGWQPGLSLISVEFPEDTVKLFYTDDHFPNSVWKYTTVPRKFSS